VELAERAPVNDPNRSLVALQTHGANRLHARDLLLLVTPQNAVALRSRYFFTLHPGRSPHGLVDVPSVELVHEQVLRVAEDLEDVRAREPGHRRRLLSSFNCFLSSRSSMSVFTAMVTETMAARTLIVTNTVINGKNVISVPKLEHRSKLRPKRS
jgi:hypothetical protein